MTLADFTRRAAKLAIDNSPTILTSLGVVGAVSTAVLAGKASYEAADIIRLKEAQDEQRGIYVDDPREILKQRFRLVGKLYIPAVLMGAASVACIIGANQIGNRRAAGLAAALSISERLGTEYRNKVVETIGAKKEELVRADIAQDRVNANWDDSIEIYGKPQGEICYDRYSDRYVWNTEEGLRSSANDLNRIVVNQGYATAGDFYDILGMPAPSWSYSVGWTSDSPLMELRFASVLTPSRKPVKTFEFDVEPVANYRFR